MNSGRYDIFAEYGRYEDMAFHHPLLDKPEEGEDFWAEDPEFKEICAELEAEEAGRVWEEAEAINEERECEFEKIQDSPLRHLKKKRGR